MSLHLQEMLQCDLCENKFLPSFVCIPSLDGKTRPNAVEVRKNAAAIGWKVVPAARLELGRKGKADLCPACYQNYKKKE